MAGGTIVGCRWACGDGMVHGGRCEGEIAAVAGIALRGGRDVAGWFAEGGCAVVAS